MLTMGGRENKRRRGGGEGKRRDESIIFCGIKLKPNNKEMQIIRKVRKEKEEYMILKGGKNILERPTGGPNHFAIKGEKPRQLRSVTQMWKHRLLSLVYVFVQQIGILEAPFTEKQISCLSLIRCSQILLSKLVATRCDRKLSYVIYLPLGFGKGFVLFETYE